MHIFVPKLVPKPNYSLLLSRIHPLGSLPMGKQKQFNIANLGSWARGKKGEANKENVSY